MLSTINKSTTVSCSSSDLLLFPTTNNRSPSKLVNSSSSSLTFSSSKRPKPLYLSSSSYGGVSSSKCKAYEAADESIIIDDDAVAKAEAEAGAQRLKISIYFATWWGLNVVFNIYNKKVLNAFPYPWLTSTLSLAAGSLIMFFSWATKIAQPPQTDFDFWKSLFPVALSHTIFHIPLAMSPQPSVFPRFLSPLPTSSRVVSLLSLFWSQAFFLGSHFPSLYISLFFLLLVVVPLLLSPSLISI